MTGRELMYFCHPSYKSLWKVAMCLQQKSRKRGSLEGESQDALTLSSVFPSASKSLCDLSHVTSSPGTSSSLPPKHPFCLFVSTQIPKFCWNSFLPRFAPTDPNTSGCLHQSEH